MTRIKNTDTGEIAELELHEVGGGRIQTHDILGDIIGDVAEFYGWDGGDGSDCDFAMNSYNLDEWAIWAERQQALFHILDGGGEEAAAAYYDALSRLILDGVDFMDDFKAMQDAGFEALGIDAGQAVGKGTIGTEGTEQAWKRRPSH